MKLSEKNTLEKIKVEIALMEMVKHENIVRYYETYKYMECLFMVIEYCDGGYFFSLNFSVVLQKLFTRTSRPFPSQ